MHWGRHNGAFAIWCDHVCIGRIEDRAVARDLAGAVLMYQRTIGGRSIGDQSARDQLTADLMAFVVGR